MHLLSASEDGKWLAAANTDCEIHVYNLHKLKVIWKTGELQSVAERNCTNCLVSLRSQLHCTVPVYNSCPSAIAINPASSNLVSVHADQQVSSASDYFMLWCPATDSFAFALLTKKGGTSHLQITLFVLQIFEYSLLHKEYTEWSRKLQKQGPHPLWLERDTPVTHISFSPKNPAHIFLHDMFMFCIVDQSLVRERCQPSQPAQFIFLSLFSTSVFVSLVSTCSPSLRRRQCSTIRWHWGVSQSPRGSDTAMPLRCARVFRCHYHIQFCSECQELHFKQSQLWFNWLFYHRVNGRTSQPCEQQCRRQ